MRARSTSISATSIFCVLALFFTTHVSANTKGQYAHSLSLKLVNEAKIVKEPVRDEQDQKAYFNSAAAYDLQVLLRTHPAIKRLEEAEKKKRQAMASNLKAGISLQVQRAVIEYVNNQNQAECSPYDFVGEREYMSQVSKEAGFNYTDITQDLVKVVEKLNLGM